MKGVYSIVTACFMLISLNSCFKEDERVAPHQPGNALVDTVPLTSLYKYQVYYNLATAAAVAVNDRNFWDLAFESSPEGWHVRLNTGCFMMAADLGEQQFGSMPDTTAASWNFDNSNGNNDSTAIGRWLIPGSLDTLFTHHLYIVNRGIDEQGNDRGLQQLILDSLLADTYYFRVADFNGANARSVSVRKQPDVNQVLFSFNTDAFPVQEPPSVNWDLLFTQYTTLLYTDIGEPYPYLVTGVLTNSKGVGIARDSIHEFAGITKDSIQGLNFSNRQDFLGYDWKSYDFDTGAYTVKTDIVYIIRDREGYFYKLRFIGFYNEKGEKGFPSFEFQKL